MKKFYIFCNLTNRFVSGDDYNKPHLYQLKRQAQAEADAWNRLHKSKDMYIVRSYNPNDFRNNG